MALLLNNLYASEWRQLRISPPGLPGSCVAVEAVVNKDWAQAAQPLAEASNDPVVTSKLQAWLHVASVRSEARLALQLGDSNGDGRFANIIRSSAVSYRLADMGILIKISK